MSQIANFKTNNYPKIAVLVTELEKYKKEFAKFEKQTKRSFIEFQDRHEEIWDGILEQAKAEKLIPKSSTRDKIFMTYNYDTGMLSAKAQGGDKKELMDLAKKLMAYGEKNGLPVPDEMRQIVAADSGEDPQDDDEVVVMH